MVALTDPSLNDPTPNDQAAPTRAMIEQAAAWRVQLADADCTDTDRAGFESWMCLDPAHRIAFDRMGRIEGQAMRQDRIGRTALTAMLSRRSRTLPLALIVGGTVLLSRLATHNPYVRSRLADERSGIGQIRPATLATGDHILLDSDSAADVDGSGRTVRLWRGGVMATVRPGQPHAFIIRTAQGSARALGTRFSVRISGDTTIVEVIESHVEACTTQSHAACLTLAPGQSACLDARGAHRLPDVDPFTAGAWSEGLLVADDRPLSGIIDELNRIIAPPPSIMRRRILRACTSPAPFP
ncbi:FecR domain-containing protein [Sphingobium sufflavum]|uniref:FecR family protein n=1 Tax=Sphingobium sufflavum TaxID=1129547 RepID=UPI001F1950BD|nr:FecR domain-containing protein [Sphingobium sufflavum]MCE7796579.1 FecR domain-containing protein [Sphingobium sufflavum]